jgi:hypothetical protein
MTADLDLGLRHGVPEYHGQLEPDGLDAVVNELAPGLGSLLDRDNPIVAEQLPVFDQSARDPEHIAALARSWPLVVAFVRTELDHATVGERGIGRMSTTVPRFGGHFPALARDDVTRRAVGRTAERIVVAGFCAFGGAAANWEGGLPRLVERDLLDLWRAWIPGIYAATKGAGNTTMAMLEGTIDAPGAELVATVRAAGGLKGLRKRAHARVLARIIIFYGQAGYALHALNTTMGERDFALPASAPRSARRGPRSGDRQVD